MKSEKNGILLGLAGLLLSMSATAGVVREDKGDSDWEVLFAPYLWGSSIKGSAGVGSLPPMDVDAGFSDIVDNLNMALALHTEFHRGKWALVIDPMWVSLEMEAETERDAVSVTAEADILLFELWGSYKLTPNWELIGGARLQDQKIDVDVGLPEPFPPDAGVEAEDDWLDWFLGARFNYGLGQKWRIVGRGDVKLAGDSDSAYQASLFFNRRIGKTMLLNLGYRYLDTDYENTGTYLWDVRQQGPVIGYTWSF